MCFSLGWLFSSWRWDLGAQAFSSCDSKASCSETCGVFPDQGTELVLNWQALPNHCTTREVLSITFFHEYFVLAEKSFLVITEHSSNATSTRDLPRLPCLGMISFSWECLCICLNCYFPKCDAYYTNAQIHSISLWKSPAPSKFIKFYTKTPHAQW